jgi:hypothetical protein
MGDGKRMARDVILAMDDTTAFAGVEAPFVPKELEPHQASHTRANAEIVERAVIGPPKLRALVTKRCDEQTDTRERGG